MSFDPSFIDSVFFNSGALSAAGATATFQVAEQNISSLTDFLIQVTAASIPAGGNVVFKIEGSLDGTNYFNLNTAGNTTVASNGPTFVTYSNMPLKYIRCNLVSFSSGSPTASFVIGAK